MDKSDVSKSLGLDNIHPRFLKELKYEIAELLVVMCNIIKKKALCWRVDKWPSTELKT